MKLKIDADVISNALKIATKHAPSTTGTVTLDSDGSKLYMHSSSDIARCSILMPCEVSGKARSFAIAALALSDAIKNRKELSIEYDKTMLNIVSVAGKYTSSLATSDALPMDDTNEEAKQDVIKISNEQAIFLKSAVSTVALKPTVLKSPYMPLGVKLSDKGAFISCFDNDHVAFLKSKDMTGDLEFVMPHDTLLSILDTFSIGKFTVQLGTTNLYVKNKLVSIQLNLPQEEDDAITLEQVMAQAKEALKMDASTVEVNKEELTAFLDNARSVATKERGEITIEASKGKMNMSVTTVNGSSSTEIKANISSKFSVKVDYEYFEEAIRKSSNAVTMRVVGDAFIAVQMKNSTILIALNQ